MANPGASMPPDGHRSRGYQLIAAHAVLLAVSIVLLSARLFTRAFILAELGLDDLFIVFGVVSNLLWITFFSILSVWLIAVALLHFWVDHWCLHGSKWTRSSHTVLPFKNWLYPRPTKRSHQITVYKPDYHHTRSHVHQSIYNVLPVANFRARQQKVVEMESLPSHGDHRSDESVFCYRHSDSVSPARDTLGYSCPWTLLVSDQPWLRRRWVSTTLNHMKTLGLCLTKHLSSYLIK